MRRNDTLAGASSRIADRIGSVIRGSVAGLGVALGALTESPSPSPPPRHKSAAATREEDDGPQIRWLKGEFLGSGAFGQVYMGMNIDSGELLAVKQVLIGRSSGTREKAQAHVKELEEEVKVLKKLSHPNIVRYLGTVRENETLNILLEFVPGGSIQSLLGKLGPFPEPVIRKFTKQLLQGLEYLHRNGIIHRDIKGANILVDNTGIIKLADFGASKQVFKLATLNAAKTMKGTPNWMAPEVIDGSGHSFSADIWSVGCTVIEMVIGHPPWSNQYQEVASLLFHVGTTKSHPPIPEHLSHDAKDFLLKCLNKEADLRPTAAELLEHPFTTVDKNTHPSVRAAHKDVSKEALGRNPVNSNMVSNTSQHSSGCLSIETFSKPSTSRPIWDKYYLENKCRIDEREDFPIVGLSFNPMSEPMDDWSSEFDTSSDQRGSQSKYSVDLSKEAELHSQTMDYQFSFPCEGSCEEDDELIESKIREFLDEKAIELKKLQTPLFEEFYNTTNTLSCQGGNCNSKGTVTTTFKLPPRGKSSPKTGSGLSAHNADASDSPEICSKRVSGGCLESSRILKDISHSQLNEWGDVPRVDISSSTSPSCRDKEKLRKWEEELAKDIEQQREMHQSNKRERSTK